jgi:hypothetical protein
MSNDWFLKLSNNFIRFWLHYFYCFYFIRILRNPIYPFDSNWILRNIFDFFMIDCKGRLLEEFHMLYCKRFLRYKL